MVTQENGATLVIDLTGMAKFLSEFGGDLKNDPYNWGEMSSLRETGAREAVAGIEGNVYALKFKNANGQTESLEAVLTDHELAVELMQRYADTLQNTFDIGVVAELLANLPKDHRGVLRMGRYLHVKSLSNEAPSDELFKLPGEPVSIGDLMKG